MIFQNFNHIFNELGSQREHQLTQEEDEKIRRMASTDFDLIKALIS
jgi:hypothetical protein